LTTGRFSANLHINAQNIPVRYPGIGSFLLFRDTASMYVLLIFYGLSMGKGTPLLILIPGHFYGSNVYGAIPGTSPAISAKPGLLSLRTSLSGAAI
jgi:hypothetical protein